MSDLIAKDLLGLLEQRHSNDLFVPECKDGPTHMVSHSRLDAWVMRKSWNKPAVYGYEIKVSRSDFLQDDKWPNYLPMCNEFYFVCPSGLIDPREIPDGAGLLWAARTGTRLYRKLKAPYRDVEIPESVFRYVLMCRTTITSDAGDEDMHAFWDRWLDQRRLDWEFGHRVGKAIKERIAQEITAVRYDNQRLQQQVKNCEALSKILVQLGFEPDRHTWEHIIRRAAVDVTSVLPTGLIGDLDKSVEALSQARESLAQLDGSETGGK